MSCVFSSLAQKQKVTKSNKFYHTYKKEGDVLRIYDIDKNLVREVHLNKKIAFNFYNRDILLTNMEDSFFLNKSIINSNETKEYLYTKIDCKYSIETDEGSGYKKEYKIDANGFKELISSNSIYDNERPPLLLSEKEQKKIEQEQDSLAKLQSKVNYKTEKKISNDILKYTKYKNDKREVEYIIKFNKENLVSNVFLLFVIDLGSPQERYEINIQKAFYDKQKNLIKIKEWTSRNYKQFKDVIQKKGEDYFFKEVFENTEKCFKLNSFLTKQYIYDKEFSLTEINTVDHSYNNETTKVKYEYDNKNRLVKSTTFLNGLIQKQDIFNYD